MNNKLLYWIALLPGILLVIYIFILMLLSNPSYAQSEIIPPLPNETPRITEDQLRSTPTPNPVFIKYKYARNMLYLIYPVLGLGMVSYLLYVKFAQKKEVRTSIFVKLILFLFLGLFLTTYGYFLGVLGSDLVSGRGFKVFTEPLNLR